MLTDCKSETSPYVGGEDKIKKVFLDKTDDGKDQIKMVKVEENGELGIRLCVACSNKEVTKSAKIKVS